MENNNLSESFEEIPHELTINQQEFLVLQCDSLKEKYKKMSLLELKKQQRSLFQNIHQLHEFLNELILDKFQAQNYQRQKQKMTNNNQTVQEKMKISKKMQNSLLKSLLNFQFMLSNQYPIKMQEQIRSTKQRVKQLQQQVSLLSRQMSIPMQKDIEICEKLQKHKFDLQLQIKEIQVKNMNRRRKIQELLKQNKQKLKLTKQQASILQKLQENSQQLTQIDNKKENSQKILELQIQKERLTSIIYKTNRQNKQQYVRLKKAALQINETSDDIEYYLHQIEKTIKEKVEEVKLNKQQLQFVKNQTKAQKRKQKIYTQGNKYPEYQSMIKKDYHRQKRQSSFHLRTQSKSKTEKQILPSIYEVLGKKKLLIEEDCDLDYLLYKGIQ